MRSNAFGDGDPSKSTHLTTLQKWEKKVVVAVGSVISFWGFKENHGRIWALLYLRDTPLRSADIQNLLGLSKGSVSMLLQDLETWNIVLIHKSKKPKTYTANDKLVEMIVYVFQQREKGLLLRTQSILQEALQESKEANATQHTQNRIASMIQLTKLLSKVLTLLTTLSPLNIPSILKRFIHPS